VPARKRPAARDGADALVLKRPAATDGTDGAASGAPDAVAGGIEAAADAAARGGPSPDSVSEGAAVAEPVAGGLRAVLEPIIAIGASHSQSPPSTAEAQATALEIVAKALVNEWDLWIAGQPHCIVELEAYIYGPGHADPYTHGDDGQNCCGVWYFHRRGGSFKSGTFKGLDLACGDGSRGVFAGLLVRSVRTLAGELIEGPCLVVDRILELSGAASIAGFVEGKVAAELPAESTENLCLRPAKAPRSEAVWAAPRVGLVLRAEGKTHMAGDRPADFVARPYRFSTAPWRLVKFRAGFAAPACLAASTAAAVEELGRQLALPKIAEYKDAVDRGVRLAEPGRFLDQKITTQGVLCELFGACSADV